MRPALLCLALAAGCVPSAPRRANLGQLQTRAAFDLGCPPSQLSLYHFDERNKGVLGCGSRMAYVEACDRNVGGCTWMADSRFLATAPAAPPPAPLAPLRPPCAAGPPAASAAAPAQSPTRERLDLDIRD